MTDARRAPATPLAGVGGLADACRWVADAHDAQDPEQVVWALCEIYRMLASQGWVPTTKASVLLSLHATAVDLELEQLVHGRRPEHEPR